MACSCAARGWLRGFRIWQAVPAYSKATIAIIVVFGALTGLDNPDVWANLPTPQVGVWERISIGAFILWLAILAIRLLRARGHRSVKMARVSDFPAHSLHNAR